jgi:hypothetical protein
MSIRRESKALVRLLAGLLLAGLLTLAGCATGKPSPDRAQAPSTAAIDYYPLLPSWGWAYQVERDGVEVLAVYSVVEAQKDLAVVKNGDDRISYALMPDGIARREGPVTGDYLLRTPVVAGKEWPVTDGTAKVVEVEKSVALPSGSYAHCLVVEEVRQSPSRITRTTYCQGVGPVEIEVSVFDPMKQSFGVVAHARLMSFSHPDSSAAF